MKDMRSLSAGILISACFFALGLAFIQKSGLHYDASYELGCFYSCDRSAFSLMFKGLHVPLMVLPYVGALKAWLYWPILHFLDLTPLALRLPLLLIGTLTVWMSFRFLDQISGRRAAI